MTRAAGMPFERRCAQMDEYLRCLEALWTPDPLECAAEFHTVPRSYPGPRPVQRPLRHSSHHQSGDYPRTVETHSSTRSRGRTVHAQGRLL